MVVNRLRDLTNDGALVSGQCLAGLAVDYDELDVHVQRPVVVTPARRRFAKSRATR
jgi:hypothetical protein